MYLEGGALGPNFHFPNAHEHVLPQTNLTINLPLVSNLPPENFSVKDPHLLKPPAALGAMTSQHGRRASDGGAYFRPYPMSTAEAPANLGSNSELGTGGLDGGSSSTESSVACERPESPIPYMVEQYLSQGKRHTIASTTPSSVMLPDSPRKRRTGLHTVMEKPPEIHPELVQEVEIRMRNSTSPLSSSSALSEQQQQQQQQSPVPSTSPSSLSATITGFTSVSPMTSPSNPGSSLAGGGGGSGGSLRQRRTGLSTVMEVGKPPTVGGGGLSSSSSSSYKESHSLHLPTERYSPVRRLSEGSPSFLQYRSPLTQQSSLPSSSDPSPSSDVRALQEECRRLQSENPATPPTITPIIGDCTAAARGSITGNNTGTSTGNSTQNSSLSTTDSSSSGCYVSSSPNFLLLRPPSPGILADHQQHIQGLLQLPRRSSDSGVEDQQRSASAGAAAVVAGGGTGIRQSTSATSEPLRQLMDEMYNNSESASPSPISGGPSSISNSPSSRRFSYPNSPVHVQQLQQQQQQQPSHPSHAAVVASPSSSGVSAALHAPPQYQHLGPAPAAGISHSPLAKQYSQQQQQPAPAGNLTQHLQSLCLQQNMNSESATNSTNLDQRPQQQQHQQQAQQLPSKAPATAAVSTPSSTSTSPSNRNKGSITQGIPGKLNRGSSLKAARHNMPGNNYVKTIHSSVGHHQHLSSGNSLAASGILMAQSQSFHEAFQKQQRINAGGGNLDHHHPRHHHPHHPPLPPSSMSTWGKHLPECGTDDYNISFHHHQQQQLQQHSHLQGGGVSGLGGLQPLMMPAVGGGGSGGGSGGANPEICVTNDVGDKIKFVLTEPMDESC